MERRPSTAAMNLGFATQITMELVAKTTKVSLQSNCSFQGGYIISSWWLNHPCEKYAHQIGSFPPKFGVQIPKILGFTTQIWILLHSVGGFSSLEDTSTRDWRFSRSKTCRDMIGVNGSKKKRSGYEVEGGM